MSLDITLGFSGANDIGDSMSNGGFSATLNSRTGGAMANSSLLFIVNSTLNSLVISCYDTSAVVFTAQCQSLMTLNTTCNE